MSSAVDDWPTVPPELVDEVKAFVRIDHALDDDAIAGFIRSAAALCEEFTGQIIIARGVRDIRPATTEWQKLGRIPVQIISAVESVDYDGAVNPLAATDYAIDIDANGMGWVRLHRPLAASRIAVTYRAGLSAQWSDLPETLHQGIVRLAGFLYANRDGGDAGGPPSAVTALWQPHRRMRIA